MRITNKMMSYNFLQNLERSKGYLEKIQNKLSSGKMINCPSDDPLAVYRIMSLRTTIDEMEQYDKNMQDASGLMEIAESALNNLNQVLQRAREQAIYGAGGTLPLDAVKAIAVEVGELIKEAVQVANTTFGDIYVFGGTYTAEPPFKLNEEENAVEYFGDLAEIKYEVSSGVQMAVNASPQAFGLEAAEGKINSDVFGVLIELKNRLETGSGSEIANLLGDIDKVIDNVLSERASLGARSNRMNIALERSSNSQLEFTKMISRLEDADYAKLIIDFNVQEATYHAALQTGARTLQPTLLDFLR